MTKRAGVHLGLALWLALLACLPGRGQDSRPAEQAPAASSSSTNLTLLPVVFYTPETHWAGGLAGLLSFWPASQRVGTRPSTISAYAIYTELRQFQLEIDPILYFDDEDLLLQGNWILERYPNKYWGIGNDALEAHETNYTPGRVFLETSFQKRLLAEQNLYIGVQYQFEQVTIIEAQRDGPLPFDETPGSAGGTVSGLGVILNWDTRDHIFIPSRGNYFQVSLSVNSSALGSDFSFTEIKADLRKFFRGLAASHVLGLHLLYQSVIGGTPPFFRYARLGSDNIMRGYYAGRFRDRHLLAAQAEYRLPVWWKFGLVGFFGLGRVAPDLSGLGLSGMKYSAGLGLRFKIAPREGANLRVDWAFGQGTSGLYFTAGEAF